MNKLITINREFGSGGRELARRLSDELQIAYYDHEVIKAIAEKTEFSEEYVQSIVEKRPFLSFPITVGNHFYVVDNMLAQQMTSIFQAQSDIIREMAERSDCIIVGRCANHILREMNPYRIFVYADMESRINRCREKAPADEHLSNNELKKQIQRMDKNRAAYYETYTGDKWTDRLNYDLCINTSGRVIKDLAPVIAKLFA